VNRSEACQARAVEDRQAAVDARILAYYGEEFDESARLSTRSAQGPLELERTLEVIPATYPVGR